MNNTIPKTEWIKSWSENGVGWIQLSHENKLNFLSAAFILAIRDAAQEFDNNPSIGCIVLIGSEKAFAAGADFVMIGGLLAGHDECDGDIVTKHIANNEHSKLYDGSYVPHFEERKFMKFYGMASKTAMDKHNVPTREYRGVEGKTVTVPYKGPVKDTLIDILSGIRSACTYVGAKRLKSLSKCATFVRVNNTHNTVFGEENVNG